LDGGGEGPAGEAAGLAVAALVILIRAEGHAESGGGGGLGETPGRAPVPQLRWEIHGFAFVYGGLLSCHSLHDMRFIRH
jgi:hypothetical protein